MSKAPAIGIDLGTTRSRAAVFRNGRLEVIHTDLDSPYMSNVVGYARTKFEGRPSENEDSFTSERVIGHYASELAGEKDACNKVFNIKRIMGRSYDATVASDSKYVPFTVLSCSYDPHWPQFNFNFHGSEKPMVKLCSNDVHQGVRSSYYPEEISAMLLGKVKEAAERHLGMPVTDAVISVPACFNDAQRQATLDAAAIAGLNVLCLINDPTAVAIQYYREKEPSDPRKVLIFNLGGGTCEVSNVVVGEDGIGMTSSVGDSHLGGEDFVDALMEYAFRGIDQRKKNSLHRLDSSDVDWMRRSCKRTMCRLSSFERAELEIESLSCKIMYTESLTRMKFEELNSGLFDRISTLLSKAGKGFEGVIMVGHSSAIPKVQTLLKKRLKVEGFVNFENPGVSVARGAAILAAKLQGDKTTGLPIVAEILSRSLCYKFFGEKTKDLVEKNVHYIPFSTIKKYQFRSNEEDRYAIVEEYEDHDKKKKRTIGKFDIVGPFDESIFKEMCKRGRGRPVIDVEFCVDWNGVLQVSAQTVGDTFRIFPCKCRKFREDQIDILEYHFLTQPSKEEKERIRDIVKNSLEYFLSTCSKTEKSDKLKEWFDAHQMKASTDQFREKLWRFNSAYK